MFDRNETLERKTETLTRYLENERRLRFEIEASTKNMA